MFLFALLTLILGAHDETGDDNMMQLYIGVSDGNPSSFQIWTSVFWGAAVAFLQKCFGFFAWHYLLQLILIVIALTLIIGWFLDNIKCAAFFRWSVPFVFTILIYYQSVYLFNFTRTSALIIAAGILFLFGEKKRFVSVLLFVLAGVLRFDTVYIAIGYCLAAFVAVFFFKMTEKVRRVACIILSVSFVFLINAGQSFLLSYNKEWNEVKAYNNAASSVVDYGLKDYEENKALYEEYAVSDNDYRFLTGRLAGSDPDVYTKERLNEIGTIFSEKGFTDNLGGKMIEFAKAIVKAFVISPTGALAAFVLLLVLIFGAKKERVFSVLLLAGSFAYIGLFVLMGRAPERVLFAVTLMMLCTLLPLLKKTLSEKTKDTKLQRASLRVLPVFLAIVCLSAPFVCKNNTEIVNSEEFETIQENGEEFYAYYGLDEAYSVSNILLTKDYWDTSNTFRLSLFAITPHEKAKLEKYGINNIYRDSIGSDTIRFICSESSIKIIKKYIEEHYSEGIDAVVCKNFDKNNVYKIVKNNY